MSELQYSLRPDVFQDQTFYDFNLSNAKHTTQSNYKVWRTNSTSSVDSEDLFKKLVAEWRSDTGHLSVVSQRLGHPAYIQIMQMGASAIPLILEELERRPDHWFYALTQLTQENPIPVNFNGTIADAIDLWISWGRSRKQANFTTEATRLIPKQSTVYAS